MIDRILELPLIWAWGVLWCVAMLRANLIHWMGRGLGKGAEHSRFSGMLTSPMYVSAQAMAERWGIIAVPLSFMTVGVQSFVQLWAGVTLMPLRRYLPAVMVGAAIWATIYATVGLAVFAAWVGAGGGWAIAALVAVAALVIWARGRRQRAQSAVDATVQEHAAPIRVREAVEA
ncbi:MULTISPECIES: DedA family protein [Actinomyces]|uniref:VTT domain-containing protein n=1 Tax=Actinomyces respiraculi TaxID=2744574 RepID=A0A7T0LJR9_9ACTO|nr:MULTISPECIES: VTT domain-containing protein [Actinomyces]QPL04618.1 VTT domain-containing protein [Actinomyces respiraculi]